MTSLQQLRPLSSRNPGIFACAHTCHHDLDQILQKSKRSEVLKKCFIFWDHSSIRKHTNNVKYHPGCTPECPANRHRSLPVPFRGPTHKEWQEWGPLLFQSRNAKARVPPQYRMQKGRDGIEDEDLGAPMDTRMSPGDDLDEDGSLPPPRADLPSNPSGNQPSPSASGNFPLPIAPPAGANGQIITRQAIFELFRDLPLDPGLSDILGRYNKLLYTAFTPSNKYTIVPRVVGSAEIRPGFDVIFGAHTPVLSLMIFHQTTLTNASSRANADAIMRRHLLDLSSSCILEILPGVVACGTKLAFYTIAKRTRRISPLPMPHDVAPAERWDSCDLQERIGGAQRFWDVIAEIRDVLQE